MTALTMPARPEEDDAGLRPVPWRQLAWVTWRQHRFALGARPEVACCMMRLFVRPHATMRGDLRLVMVRRNQRRTGVEGQVRDLRIDDERQSLA